MGMRVLRLRRHSAGPSYLQMPSRLLLIRSSDLCRISRSSLCFVSRCMGSVRLHRNWIRCKTRIFENSQSAQPLLKLQSQYTLLLHSDAVRRRKIAAFHALRMTEKEAAGEELSLNVSFFTERGFARMEGIVKLCKTWLASSGIPPAPALPTSGSCDEHHLTKYDQVRPD